MYINSTAADVTSNITYNLTLNFTYLEAGCVGWDTDGDGAVDNCLAYTEKFLDPSLLY
jgi:hypothetical protein